MLLKLTTLVFHFFLTWLLEILNNVCSLHYISIGLYSSTATILYFLDKIGLN